MKRNNHYNSQMYLKAWECEKNKTLVYDLLVSDERVPMWSKKSIENLCSIDSLFVRLENEIEKDDIETWFEQRFETPAKNALENAINKGKVNCWEMHKLVDFMACHIVRNPVFIGRTLNLAQNKIKEEFEKKCKKLQYISEDDIKKIFNETDTNSLALPLKMEKVKDVGENELWKMETVIGKQFYLCMMKWALENFSKVLHKHDWQILTLHPWVKIPTSDDPVICLNYNSKDNYDFRGGWDTKYGSIIFPISPNRIFYTEIGTKFNQNTNLDYVMSLFFKRIIIEHAHRKVISSFEDKEVTFIRSRYVNRDMFNNEKTMWKNFQATYLKEESKYIK